MEKLNLEKKDKAAKATLDKCRLVKSLSYTPF